MDKFDVFYYSNAFISDKRTLSLLGILSDSLYVFYLSPDYFLVPFKEKWGKQKSEPFFEKAPVEIEIATSIHKEKYASFLEENRELIEAGVIHPIHIMQKPPDWECLQELEKKMMKDYSGLAIGMWGTRIGLFNEFPSDNVYIDAPYFSLYRWLSLSGALYFAIKADITPISDNAKLSSLAIETVRRFSDVDHKYNLDDLSKLLGFKVLSHLLPNFGGLSPQQILEVREHLKDELLAFRNEMIELTVQSRIDEGYLDNYVDRRVKPRVNDIKLKMKSSKTSLFRKISAEVLAAGTGTTLLTQFLQLPLHAQISVGFGLVGKILLDYFEYKDHRKEIVSQSGNSGLALILDLENRYSKNRK